MQDSDRSDDTRFTSDSPQRGRRGRQGRPRRIGQIIKWTFLTLFCLTSLGIGTVAGNFYQRSKLFATIFGTYGTRNGFIGLLKGDPFAAFTVDDNFVPNPQHPNQQHALNILVLGCDSDYYDDKPVPIKGSLGRSDAIMVAHVDFDKNTLSVLSIPRDTAVPIPGHRGYRKVNAAHSYGGNDLSATTIHQDFGINSDYTISLDFDSFQKVVDAVHGVDLTVDKKLDYDDNWGNLHIHLKPGYQHLNGYHAMGYVRIRHSDDDLHRTERQHEFIEALRKKVMDPSNFMALPTVMNAITDDIKSNLTQNQELTLVHWATKLDKNSIQLTTLPSTEDRKYVYADKINGAAIIAQMFYGGNLSAVTLNVASHNQLAMNTRTSHLRHRPRRRVRQDAAPAAAGGANQSGQPELTPAGATQSIDEAPSDSNTSPGSAPPMPTSPGGTDGNGHGAPGTNPSPGSGGASSGGNDKGTGDHTASVQLG